MILTIRHHLRHQLQGPFSHFERNFSPHLIYWVCVFPYQFVSQFGPFVLLPSFCSSQLRKVGLDRVFCVSKTKWSWIWIVLRLIKKSVFFRYFFIIIVIFCRDSYFLFCLFDGNTIHSELPDAPSKKDRKRVNEMQRALDKMLEESIWAFFSIIERFWCKIKKKAGIMGHFIVI